MGFNPLIVVSCKAMPPKNEDASFNQIMLLFQNESTSIERLGWKNMGPEQFTESYLMLLKGLCRICQRPKNSSLREILAASKLAVSAAERELFVSKITTAISYSKRKGRDAGSGKFLPSPVASLLKSIRLGKASAAPKKDLILNFISSSSTTFNINKCTYPEHQRCLWIGKSPRS